ncbi:hypothetical protein CMI45_02170 [Candidatus Pacearchaeota archaeon]|jgi:hypothetical protein|nr:hypothetical protein [Candidatus Pacearchaeota archaeon]|tara:strand:- start:35 stop:511 length:477 start_codon:yes stop_codon:yes gene_type:complete
MKWTDRDIKYLVNNYSKRVHVDDICLYLKRGRRSVQHKAVRLGVGRKGMLVKRMGDVTPREIIDKRYYLKNKSKVHRRRMDRRWRIKLKLVKLMGGKCSLCGYNRCVPALEFHHKTKEKDASIAELIKNTSEQNVLKEVKRCVLVCANCHRELHQKDP